MVEPAQCASVAMDAAQWLARAHKTTPDEWIGICYEIAADVAGRWDPHRGASYKTLATRSIMQQAPRVFYQERDYLGQQRLTPAQRESRARYIRDRLPAFARGAQPDDAVETRDELHSYLERMDDKRADVARMSANGLQMLQVAAALNVSEAGVHLCARITRKAARGRRLRELN